MKIKEDQSFKFFNQTTRFLLGFILLAAGIYVAALSGVRGSGLGYIMILTAPFLFVEDSKQS